MDPPPFTFLRVGTYAGRCRLEQMGRKTRISSLLLCALLHCSRLLYTVPPPDSPPVTYSPTAKKSVLGNEHMSTNGSTKDCNFHALTAPACRTVVLAWFSTSLGMHGR